MDRRRANEGTWHEPTNAMPQMDLDLDPKPCLWPTSFAKAANFVFRVGPVHSCHMDMEQGTSSRVMNSQLIRVVYRKLACHKGVGKRRRRRRRNETRSRKGRRTLNPHSTELSPVVERSSLGRSRQSLFSQVSPRLTLSIVFVSLSPLFHPVPHSRLDLFCAVPCRTSCTAVIATAAIDAAA